MLDRTYCTNVLNVIYNILYKCANVSKASYNILHKCFQYQAQQIVQMFLMLGTTACTNFFKIQFNRLYKSLECQVQQIVRNKKSPVQHKIQFYGVSKVQLTYRIFYQVQTYIVQYHMSKRCFRKTLLSRMLILLSITAREKKLCTVRTANEEIQVNPSRPLPCVLLM